MSYESMDHHSPAPPDRPLDVLGMVPVSRAFYSESRDARWLKGGLNER
jgi:hypothetical protein